MESSIRGGWNYDRVLDSVQQQFASFPDTILPSSPHNFLSSLYCPINKNGKKAKHLSIHTQPESLLASDIKWRLQRELTEGASLTEDTASFLFLPPSLVSFLHLPLALSLSLFLSVCSCYYVL